jgi:hypothetical protein
MKISCYKISNVIFKDKGFHIFTLIKFNIIVIHQLDMKSLVCLNKVSLVVAFKSLDKEQI